MSEKMKFSKSELKMPQEQFGGITPVEKTSFSGVILGLLIIVLTIILGGLYLWSVELQKETASPTPTETTRPTVEENNEPESTKAEAEVETFSALSTSDEIGALEADLESTNLETLTNEIQTIDAALE